MKIRISNLKSTRVAVSGPGEYKERMSPADKDQMSRDSEKNEGGSEYPDWLEKMSPEHRRQYFKDHPDSKYK